jgi:hypothetical protein
MVDVYSGTVPRSLRSPHPRRDDGGPALHLPATCPRGSGPKDEPHPVVEPVTVCHARARVVLAGRATSVPFTAGLDRYPADNHGQRYTSLERHRSLPSQVTILPDLALGARGRHSNAAIELSQAPQLGAQ